METSVLKSREDYIRHVAAYVRTIDKTIDRLKESSEKKDAAGRLRDKQRITELNTSRDQAVAMLSKLHESCEECWDEVKKNADRLFKVRRKTLGKAA